MKPDDTITELSLRDMAALPAPLPFVYSGSELDSMAHARNYYEWVLRQFEPYLGPTVVEVGAGLGTFSEFLLSVAHVRRLVAIEPAVNMYPSLAERFLHDDRVRVLNGYLSDHFDSLHADSIAAVNVLEHVKDDSGFLAQARDAVVPGGTLLLFVPALPILFGSLDRVFEHERRYTRTSLQAVIENAGWSVNRINYMNLPGIAAWFVAGQIMKKTRVAAMEVRAYDRFVMPWLSRIEAVLPPPIGSNLLAIATRI